jgi:hypothetical protein
MMMFTPSLVWATVDWNGAFEFTNSVAQAQYFSGHGCQSDGCIMLPSPNGATAQVNSSDVSVAQEAALYGLADGETASWKAIKPDGSTVFIYSLTWNEALGCFIGSDLQQYCIGSFLEATESIGINSCSVAKTIGSWSLGIYDNNTLLWSNPLTVSHNPSGLLGITSPTDNLPIQLAYGNYNFTGPVQFTAGTSAGSSISWSNQLHYLSSGGYGGPDPAPVTNNGASFSYAGYQSIGGQVVATASTTIANGSTVQDCVTFYVEGPESGILGGTITSQLDSLYTNSTGYKTINDGTVTSNLMTGVAMRESSYHQFLYPGELPNGQNPDLFNLQHDFSIDAFWPNENIPNQYAGAGEYIGLMQVGPTTDSDAWDWTQNTTDAVNLFSGTTSPNKIQLAITYEGDIRNGATYTVKNKKYYSPGHVGLRTLKGFERENMALILYGGFLSSCAQSDLACQLSLQYYAPICPSPGVQGTNKQGNLTCSTGWQWSPNTAQSKGLAYVQNGSNGIRDLLQ